MYQLIFPSDRLIHFNDAHGHWIASYIFCLMYIQMTRKTTHSTITIEYSHLYIGRGREKMKEKESVREKEISSLQSFLFCVLSIFLSLSLFFSFLRITNTCTLVAHHHHHRHHAERSEKNGRKKEYVYGIYIGYWMIFI